MYWDHVLGNAPLTDLIEEIAVSKIEWDSRTGGVVLKRHITKETLSVSPRPVFFEELDLLKLKDFGYSYPKCDGPIMWACNKQYFYRGEQIFEVKGANIYDAPTVVFKPGFEKGIKLKPVNVAAMLKRNRDELFVIESEAIEFIRDTYLMYASTLKTVEAAQANELDYEVLAARAEKRTKTKMAIVKEDCDSFDVMPLEKAEAEGKRVYQTTRIDRFLASFSGGKDSQVVLDLCTRAIPPENFEVIYSDTGYELPPSLQLYKEIADHYQQIYPKLKFSVARNHASVLSYWDRIGTPSDTHRWCCAVMKTGPLYRMLKTEDGRQAKVLTFDGVRAEESTRRSRYERIGKGVKHGTVINVSPILYWNTVEIFLYLFKYDLPINPAYRQGMTRVGCLVCPFSSEWNDMISNTHYHEQVKPFLERIEKITKSSGVQDVKDYIKLGNWKRRAGGRDMHFPSFMQIQETKPDISFIITKPQKDIFTWLESVGSYHVSYISDGKFSGELRYDGNVFKFIGKSKGDVVKITFNNTFQSPILQGLLKRVFYKATYCVDCTVCEVECPTGALSILPTPRINSRKCVHCQKCLTFHEHGCIAAHSLAETGIQGNDKNLNKMKLISYNNFGMNSEWTDYFLSSYDTYFDDNSHGLHPKEILPNFVKWLVQAGILNNTKDKQITALGKKLADIYIDMPDVLWQIIWINLSYSSPIARWYKENIEWGYEFTQKDIEELLKTDYPDMSPKTLHNILYALFRTFKETPIGEMGQLISTSKQQYKKESCVDLSKVTVAYSLYKYAEEKGIRSMRVADIYSPDNKLGIYKEFGAQKSDFLNVLRELNSDTIRLLVAELNMGLDNITLRDDITSTDVLNQLL